MADQQQCEHRYLTSYGKGWVCANRACGVGSLSLAVPLPMPLVEEALKVIAASGVMAAPAPATVREFTNELGNRIRITIEGPTSTSENVLTPMEASELRQALDAHGVKGLDRG